MIIKRKLFSKKEKTKKKDNTDSLVGAGVGVAAGAAVKPAVTLANLYFNKKVENSGRIAEVENKKLTEKLVKELKDQGTEIIRTDADNSAFVGGPEARGMRKLWKKFKNSNPKVAEEIKSQAMDQLELHPMGEIIPHMGKDAVVMGKGRLSDADVLAHEIGHSKYYVKGRSKNLLAKGAHKLMVPSKLAVTAGSPVAGAIGYKSGLESAKKKANGEKESLWNKTKSVAIPAAMVAPLLVAEGAASVKGYKLLKKAGASKEALKVTRKSLGNAHGTYASLAAAPVAVGEASRLVGKAVGKKKYGKNKKDKKEKGGK